MQQAVQGSSNKRAAGVATALWYVRSALGYVRSALWYITSLLSSYACRGELHQGCINQAQCT
eukprot:351651-Chlamydomonas_euryale.AAC.3